jgi:type II secretory ATPase GspE/PulE/Tfp pilus assembly ATPase PilB-like protein
MNGDEQAIVQFVDDALCNALHLDASEIHFEICESNFTVRYRVDGAQRGHAAANNDIGGPAVRRLKVLANLNIAEHRLPEDGNFV